MKAGGKKVRRSLHCLFSANLLPSQIPTEGSARHLDDSHTLKLAAVVKGQRPPTALVQKIFEGIQKDVLETQSNLLHGYAPGSELVYGELRHPYGNLSVTGGGPRLT